MALQNIVTKCQRHDSPVSSGFILRHLATQQPNKVPEARPSCILGIHPEAPEVSELLEGVRVVREKYTPLHTPLQNASKTYGIHPKNFVFYDAPLGFGYTE